MRFGFGRRRLFPPFHFVASNKIMNENTSSPRRPAVRAFALYFLTFAAGFAASHAFRSGDIPPEAPAPPAPPPLSSEAPPVACPPAARTVTPIPCELQSYHPGDFSDFQPSVLLRSVEGAFSSNVVQNAETWISVSFEGRRVPYDVQLDSSPTYRVMGLLPRVESASGEIRVEISPDFPVPGGFAPLEKPLVLTRQYAAVAVAPEMAHAEIDRFAEIPEVRIVLSRDDVSADSVASNLVFEPAVSGGVRAMGEIDYISWWEDGNYTSGNGIRLVGAFLPGRRYYAKFRPDAALASSQGAARLVSTNAVSFLVPKPRTAVQFLSPGDNLVPGGSHAIALRTRNAAKVRARLYRVRPERIGPALRFDWASSFDEDFCEKTGPSLVARIDEPGISTNALSLGDFLDAPLPEGLYSVSVEAFKPARAAEGAPADSEAKAKSLLHPDDSDRRLLCLSDIGICARLVGKTLQAWVVRYSTAASIPGAEVSLYGRNGEVLAVATTDGDGVVRLALPGEPDAPAPDYLAAVAPGGGYGFLQLCSARETEELATHPSERFPESGDELDGFLFSDRGIYRHGDHVLLQGLVRTAAGAAPAAPPRLKLEMRRPDGNVVARFDVVPDERGFFQVAGGWEAPASQPSGPWTAVLKLPGENGRVLARRRFSVEAFAPPKIVVEAPDATAEIAPGAEELSMCAEARWQFGTPASSLAAKAEVWTEPVSSFLPKALRGGGWSLGSRRREMVPFLLETPSLSLGPDGKATFSFQAADGRPALAGQRGRGPGPFKVVRQATVFEPGGRGVSASGGSLYHPWPFYAAVRTGKALPDSEVSAEVRFVRPDGAAAPEAVGLGVRLELFTVGWESRLVKKGDVWTWNSSKVETSVYCTNFVATTPESTIPVKLPAVEGSYCLVATCDAPEGFAEGPETTHDFFAWADGGDAADDMEEDEEEGFSPVKVVIKPDREKYRPGDEAALAVRAPFAGVALVTVQGRELLERFSVRLEKGENGLKIPLSIAHAPSCEVAVTLIRPVVPQAGVWRAHRALGACLLAVSDPAREIPLSVSEPELFPLPDGGLRVRAEAALVDPKPGESVRATFFLVDEALLELTHEAVPDPAARFGRPRYSGASVWDAWNALVPFSDAPLLKTSIAVGGDDGGENLVFDALAKRLSSDASHRFTPLVRAAADLAFENGVAGADFELPDFAGRLRLVVVAWSATAASGASARATVAPALVADADGPRFLCAGDESSVNCTLHNNTDRAAEVRVSLACRDGAASGDAASRRVLLSAERVVNVPAHGSAFVSEPLRVPETAGEDTWHVEFRAEGLGERRKSAFELPIRPPLPPKTVVQTVAVAPGETATLPAIEGLFGGPSAHGEIQVLSGVAALAAPALRWLDRYPWACLEQTTSRAFPLVAAQGSLRALADEVTFAPGRAEATVRAGVARVASLLCNERFRLWPECAWDVPEYSAWAGCFLAVAERERVEMADSVRANWRAAMRMLARERAPGVSWSTSSEERAAADAAHDPARALAIAALAIGGDPEGPSAQRMLDRERALPPLARARLAFALLRGGDPEAGLRLLRSCQPATTVQEASWQLLAWLEAPVDAAGTDGEFASAVSANLGLLKRLSGPDGDWGTTSANAHALLALAAHARRFGGASPSGDGDRDLQKQEGDDALAAFSWRNDGSETRFLRRETTALPVPAAAPPAPVSKGLRVSRSLLDVQGRPIDPLAGVSQGDTLFLLVEVDSADASGRPFGETVLQLPLPAGLEPLPLRSAPASAAAEGALPIHPKWVVHRETRDDRMVVFGASTSEKRLRFCCPVQAVSVGSFTLPPARVEDMYEPDVFATTETARLVVASADGT